MPANVIKVAIIGDERSLSEAAKAARSDLSKVEGAAKSHGEKVTSFANKASAAMAGGVLLVAGVALKAGMTLQESQDKLRNAISNTGGSWDRQAGLITKAQKAGEKLGFTFSETDDALAIMTRGMGSSKKALDNLALAQNVARATGKPLAEAAMLVTKASEGQIKALKAAGIDLPIAAGGALKTAKALDKLRAAQNALRVIEAAIHAGRLKGPAAAQALDTANMHLWSTQEAYNKTAASGDQILSALSAKFKGSAADASQTMAGKIKALHAKFTDFTATLGLKLIPVVIKVVNKFVQIATWIMHNKAVLAALVTVVGLFVAAMVALSIIDKVRKMMEALKYAQAALNLVMSLNPVMLVVLALVALVGGLVLAYNKVGWFRDFVNGAFSLIKRVALDAFNWVKDHWPLILAILTGPIGLAVLLISRNWDTIKGVFTTGAKWCGDRIGDIVGFFAALPYRIAGFAGAVGGAVTGAAKGALNGMIWLINKAIDFLDSFQIHTPHISLGPVDLPHFDWGGLGIGHIPSLKTGGMFSSGPAGGLAWLHDGERVLTPAQQRNGGGDTYVTFPAGSAPAAVNAAQQRWNRRNGKAA